MLSLVILVIISANVILWSYQMNQLDWERIQENLEIVDIARITSSSWFVTQSEYMVNIGSQINGTYTDTQAVDGRYESFREASNWWNSNYSYRRQIAIVNNVASTLDVGYSVCVTMDTASLVSAGKMLSSGNDLRVVYRSTSGWIELDRHLTNMNTTSTQVWFRTQAVIGASPATDDNYYMYYGNPSATSSPANKSNVYVWFDDFSTNTLANYDKAKWVDIQGAANEYVLPTYDAVNERVWFDTGDNYASDMYPVGVAEADFLIEVDFWANGSYPTDATIALVGRLENPGTSSTHYYLDFSHGTYDSPGITVDSWVNGERSNTVYSEPADYYWGFNTVHTFTYAIFGSTHKFWWNKDISQPADVIATDSLHTAAGRLGLAPAQVRGWWDNLKIRKYIEPEPSTSLGSEEMRNWWNTDYNYRRQITITNNIASTLSSGYSVLLTMDTVSLVSSGKILSTGNDLRVVYWSGSSWIGLDREVLNMNTTSTQVWFKTQAVIGSSATDSNYYIYYGNPISGSPPTNKGNIYQFWDDFDDGLLGSEWTIESIGGGSHTLTESGSALNITSHYTGDMWGTSDTFTYVYLSDYTGSLEVSTYVSSAGGLATWVKVGGVHLRDDNSTGAKNMQASPTDVYGLTNSHRKTTSGSTEEDLYGSGYMVPEYLMLRKNGNVITPLRSEDGQSWTSWASDIIVFTEPFLVGVPVCSMGSANTWAVIEWFKIRLYVGPEPSTSLGTEESQSDKRLDIDSTFVIDVSTYPSTYIQTVEIQIRYGSSDTGEKWYLKAYNWSSSTYSDSGFNSTTGHTPTTGWGYYAVNLTDKWRSYMQDNGIIYVKFVDEGVDSDQTTIDIDFLGVRVEIDGTLFTFENTGSLTSHLVSLWVTNSTHHRRYDMDVILNSGENLPYPRVDINLPTEEYRVKVVTERGNIAVYSES